MGNRGMKWGEWCVGMGGSECGDGGIIMKMRGIRVGMRGIMVGMSRGIKIKGNERNYKNIVLTFWYEKQLKKLINWKENMININVLLVGIKENNISTNPFAVDAMLPIMAKHADIWTLELVRIRAFQL